MISLLLAVLTVSSVVGWTLVWLCWRREKELRMVEKRAMDLHLNADAVMQLAMGHHRHAMQCLRVARDHEAVAIKLKKEME